MSRFEIKHKVIRCDFCPAEVFIAQPDGVVRGAPEGWRVIVTRSHDSGCVSETHYDACPDCFPKEMHRDNTGQYRDQ